MLVLISISYLSYCRCICISEFPFRSWHTASFFVTFADCTHRLSEITYCAVFNTLPIWFSSDECYDHQMKTSHRHTDVRHRQQQQHLKSAVLAAYPLQNLIYGQ